ncbi:invasion associated locus B family protein [Bartonella sp. DGB2]|uniref:invasion associated locus B family protein n=1 Tax=Bartonella sp. DGB2 TaxID=3388426 RepID=UPI00398F942F
MYNKTFILAWVMAFALCFSPLLRVAAAQTPSRLQQFQAWGTYSYRADGKSLCYALSVPLVADPANVRHGDNFFLLSKKSGTQAGFEPQLAAGYDLKEGAPVVVRIGEKRFSFFSRGSVAWLASVNDEKQLVALMRSGATMDVSATSKRGTQTHYVFSLKGVSAALNALNNCK